MQASCSAWVKEGLHVIPNAEAGLYAMHVKHKQRMMVLLYINRDRFFWSLF
jgi:hypothetical protein